MNLLVIHQMFGRKSLLPVDVNTEKKDAAMLLNEYHRAQNLSLAKNREVHQKLLETVKANITKAQQKQQYDKDILNQVAIAIHYS